MKDLTGEIFGLWLVLEYGGRDKNNKNTWLCKCICEKAITRKVGSYELINGKSKSCGCERGKESKDLTGQRFGKLIVVERNGKNKYGYSRWICNCDCGRTKTLPYNTLVDGHSNSCGCIKKSNIYVFENGYVKGITKKGEEFYLDTEDYKIISNLTWYIKNGYVVSSDKNNNMIFFHRLVMNVNDENIEVDHKDHNTKDNRKTNLRKSSDSQNQMNKTMQRNNTSGVIGVSWFATRNCWVSRISINKKRIILGYFKDIEDATKARREAEEKYHGEFRYIEQKDIRFIRREQENEI